MARFADSPKPIWYAALSAPPDRTRGTRLDANLYRDPGPMTFGRFHYKAPTQGRLQRGGRERPGGAYSMETVWSDEFEIAWTKQGDRGPLMLILHGVPCNRAQWEPIQRLLAPFCETISVDMLGMGESSMPREYGARIGRSVDVAIDKGEPTQWDWVNDVDYLEQLMQASYPNRKFFLLADDWGSGIASHYAAKHNDRLLGLIHLDPIAFDGYPVNEIQAIGRGSLIPNTPEGDAVFQQAFAAFDQTCVQILKSMVHHRERYNQYTMRLLTFPYVDQDYERNGAGDGLSDIFRARTARLNFHNLRVLSDRAAALSPAQLLPYDEEHNPLGVQYDKITIPTLIMWGEHDTMMPAAQSHRFANVLGTDDVQTTLIPDAGHFAHTDQPEKVAETIIDFVRRVVGRAHLGDIFLGYQGIWKGDERHMIGALRQIHGIEAQSRL